MFQKVIDICNLLTKIIPANINYIVAIMVILFWLSWVYSQVVYKDKNNRKNIKVLGHNTLGKTQFKFQSKYLKDVNLSVEELDLIDDFKSINREYNDIHYIVKKQDEYLDNFIKTINNTDSYGYAGISHTPLILRAGYRFGDGAEYVLFHKKRNSEHYEILNNDNDYPRIKVEKRDLKKNADELIVAISTTFQIKDDELNVLNTKQKSIIKFSTDEKGYDVILSKNQVENYINTIMSEVRQIVKEKNIKKVHLFISSSVAFTFALGRSLSYQHDSEIIVYHWERGTYPWGISVFNKYSDCMVITEQNPDAYL